MSDADDEERALRSVAIQNAQSILLARQRAEEALLSAKEALERKSTELAHSLSVMTATLDSTWDGILVTDTAGRITGHNRTYANMWHLSPEAMETRDHRKLLQYTSAQFTDGPAFVARVNDIYSEAMPESFDVLELADGRTFERFSKTLLVDQQAAGRVWSFRDMTQRRRAEEMARMATKDREAILESERIARERAEHMSEMKDEFLATLSHELRTPLSAILGWSHILRHGNRGSDDLQKGLEAIERNARMQTQLIEDLLDMSRITSGKVRLHVLPVDPNSVIDAAIETVRPAADAKGIRIEKILDSQAAPISGDPGRLQQVVWNLLSNAIKFTAKDGRVRVLLKRVDSHIEVSVADTGIGMEPEFLSLAFDRFRQADHSTTRKFRGLGLGLSIVKHLVELHGGVVAAKSDGVGRGSTFTFHLPIAVANRAVSHERRFPPASPAVSMDFKPLNLTGIKVLIVDDEPDARAIVERVLDECNAEVLVAPSADAALLMIERFRPDVLVSDIGMPDADGYELLRRVRALGETKGGQLQAVALTAFARSEDRTRALRAGFNVHVSKPVEPSDLIATVARMVGRTGNRQ